MYPELCHEILKAGLVLDCKVSAEIAKESGTLEELVERYKILREKNNGINARTNKRTV